MDELIRQILQAAPPGTVVAVVSDHGFERADRVMDVNQLISREGANGKAELRWGSVLFSLRFIQAFYLPNAVARDQVLTPGANSIALDS